MTDSKNTTKFPSNGVVTETTGPPQNSKLASCISTGSNDNDEDLKISYFLDNDDHIISGMFDMLHALQNRDKAPSHNNIVKLINISILHNDPVVEEVSNEILGKMIPQIHEHIDTVLEISKRYLADRSLYPSEECTYVRERALHIIGQVGLSDLSKSIEIRDFALPLSLEDDDSAIRLEARIIVEDISKDIMKSIPEASKVTRIPYFQRIPTP